MSKWQISESYYVHQVCIDEKKFFPCKKQRDMWERLHNKKCEKCNETTIIVEQPMILRNADVRSSSSMFNANQSVRQQMEANQRAIQELRQLL